jgi:hypothetical protein
MVTVLGTLFVSGWAVLLPFLYFLVVVIFPFALPFFPFEYELGKQNLFVWGPSLLIFVVQAWIIGIRFIATNTGLAVSVRLEARHLQSTRMAGSK